MNWFLQLPQTIKSILYLLIAVISAFFIGRCTYSQSTQDKGGVLTSKVEIRTDTIRIPQFVYDTVEVFKPTLKIVYKDRFIPKIQPNGDSTLLARVYKDEKEIIKGIKVGYTAKVSGVLDTINLSFTDTRDKILVRDSVFITKTLLKTNHPTGLYVGFQTTQSFSNYGPTIDLVRPKFSLGLGYDLKQASPQLRVGINLLRKRDP